MSSLTKGSRFIDSLVLNTIQREAVEYDDGPQLVFAGAGTGKTRVLTAKIAYLIKEKQFFPNHIFAATFTNKAAREMRERIENLVGISCKGLWIGTFHSLCARILRRESHLIGFKPAFSIYDDSDQRSLIKKVMKELQIDDRSMQPKKLLHTISKFKNACLTVNEIEQRADSYYQREIIKAYVLYQKMLKDADAMDFDDLITNTVFLFRKNPSALEAYRRQFGYVLVDEYQDTNTSQFELIKLLAYAHKRIFVVGDDDQSIYSWRGAQIENILSFDKIFSSAKVFKLEQNYRSPASVLNFANAIIKDNVNRADKQLWTAIKSEKEVLVTRFRDDRQEAEKIVESVIARKQRGVALGEMAILFRTNAQSRQFEESLRKKKVGYILVGGTSFYERKEVKDCIAYLRLLVNPKDSVSCERILNVPPRGIGNRSIEKLIELSKTNQVSLFDLIMKKNFESISGRAKTGLEEFNSMYALLIDLVKEGRSPEELLEEILALSGYIDMLENEDSEESKSRLENINELLNALSIWQEENSGRSLADFLEEVTLVSDIDKWDKEKDAINLMTLHAAKGLEFNTAFIVGVEDGLLPSRQNFGDDSKIEEERRLFYVGATRAMDHLECSYVDTRRRFGSILPMEPSRYLEAIPKELYRFKDNSFSYTATERFSFKTEERPKKRAFREPRPKREPVFSQEPQFDDFSQDTVQFRMGQMVSHAKYGTGKVLSISGFGPDMQLTILFNDGARKKMMAKFAKLQVL